jgi:hypothetical protein
MASPLKPFQEFMLTIIQGRRSKLHENGRRRSGRDGEGTQRRCKKDWLRAAQLGCGDISLDSPHSLLLFPAGRLEAVQAHHANQATSLDDIADTKKLDGP